MAHATMTAARWCRLLLALCCLAAPARAERVAAAAYPYPYANPYLASSTAALLKDRDAMVLERTEFLRLALLPQRRDIHLLEDKGTLRVRFQPQPGPAPLVFLVPGLGGSAYAGSARYVAQLLYDRGFHVLTLPSPFNWNFALAASRSGFPGYTERDSEDLYAAMQSALAAVRRDYRPEIGPIGLIGFSHGALTAAYLSKLDGERREIGFATVLLINPPVDLLETARAIDRMAELERRYTPAQRDDIEAYAFGVGREALRRDIDDPGYFADWDRRFRLADDPIRYLIGRALRVSLGSTVYVIELAQQPGILDTPISWGNRRPRFEEAWSLRIADYIEQGLIPHLQKKFGRDISPAGLSREVSLRDIGTALRRNPDIHLMHNADDFLVSASDLAYLERLFGDRARIYPYGGHLGNLWFPQNQRDLLALFEPLRHGAADGSGSFSPLPSAGAGKARH